MRNGIEPGKHILMAGMGIGDRCHVRHYQPLDSHWRLFGQLHGDFASHGVTNQARLLDVQTIEQRQQIGRHQGIAHLIRVKGGAVVAQVEADDAILVRQRTGQQAQVVQAAKEAMDQYHGRALALILVIKQRQG